jgi:hypothetical protein
MGSFLDRGVAWALVTAALAVVTAEACGGDDIKPGFQSFGGAGGAGTSGGTTSHTSATATTGVTTGTTSSATSTTTSSTASTTSASTTGTGCADPGAEPNDTEATATDLGQIGDCDNMGQSVSGVIHSPFDVDWFVFHGIDGSSFCSVDPTRHISNTSLRMCKFIQCDGSESNNFSCPSGTTSATSPDGRPGCCAMGDISFSLTCGSSQLNADNSMVYIRVDNPNALVCEAYQVDYHY